MQLLLFSILTSLLGIICSRIESVETNKKVLNFLQDNNRRTGNNDETDSDSEKEKSYSQLSKYLDLQSGQNQLSNYFEPEARSLKSDVQILNNQHEKSAQIYPENKEESNSISKLDLNDLMNDSSMMYNSYNNANQDGSEDDKKNDDEKSGYAQMFNQFGDNKRKRTKKESEKKKKAKKVYLVDESTKNNSFNTVLLRNISLSEEPVAQYEIDIHSIVPIHNEKLRSKMYDLVKNVNSYTDFNLLMAAQLILAKTDSKDFVDRPTKRPIAEIRKDFKKLSKKLGLQDYASLILNEKSDGNNSEDDSSDEGMTMHSSPLNAIIANYAVEINSIKSKTKTRMLQQFIDDNFGEPGSDLTFHELEDWKSEPVLLSEKDLQGKKITNKNVKDIIIGLNNVWKELSRKKIEKKGQDSTLFSLPYPFIVPGGRFREFYYWDTYFILDGLVRSKMYKTAFNIIRNFAHIIKTLGYIPNGTREYYKFRSQPAFFPLMLVKILGISEEIDNFILTEGLEMALKEYEWFKNYRSIEIMKNNKTHILNYFHVKTDFPRPESLSEDIKTFLSQNVRSEDEIYSNLKSGAESGWDFSSRWFTGSGIETISAFHQIPVDLNAILYKDEQIISMLLERNGMTEKAKEFGDLSDKRYASINEILWNDKVGSWNDLRLGDNSFVDHRFYFSNVFPLILDILPPSGKSTKNHSYDQKASFSGNSQEQQYSIYYVLNVYKKELFSYRGGIPVSGEGSSDQQWDFPNVWAPHQFLIVDKLVSIGEIEMALQIARAFYNSVKFGFEQNGVFYEKYNCLKLGLTGKGGEYEAQTGFGWTNGTALSFIKMFGDLLDEEYDVQNEYEKIGDYLAMKISGTEKESIIV